MTELKTELREKAKAPKVKPGPSFSWPQTKVPLVVYGIACALFLLADFTFKNDHPHVRFESWIGFNAVLGCLGVVALVGLAKFGLGILGYDKDDTDV